MAAGKDRQGFRLVHFSVQTNHLHFICEADSAMALSRGMQGLAIRMARKLNRKLVRKGKLFAQRFRARVVRTPRETRNLLVYVLNNVRHHGAERAARDWLDPCSSAAAFDGWRHRIRDPGLLAEPPPVVSPTVWLLTTGWRRHQPIAFDEAPARAGRRQSP